MKSQLVLLLIVVCIIIFFTVSFYKGKRPNNSEFEKTLHDMDDFLNYIEMPYRLSCGTLLGAIRENNFIAHDTDIDLEVLDCNYDPKVELGNHNFKLKRRLGTREKGYELTFTHKKTNINVDIFVLYDEFDYRWYASYFGRCDLAKDKMCRWKVPKDDTSQIYFKGRYFSVPKNPERYLEMKYGPDWRTPVKYSYEKGLFVNAFSLIKTDFKRKSD